MCGSSLVQHYFRSALLAFSFDFSFLEVLLCFFCFDQCRQLSTLWISSSVFLRRGGLWKSLPVIRADKARGAGALWRADWWESVFPWRCGVLRASPLAPAVTLRSALPPDVGNLRTVMLPPWWFHNGVGLWCLDCQHLSAERKWEGSEALGGGIFKSPGSLSESLMSFFGL